jgi:predicted DNA-binding ArsR family transcriptional regulator
MNQKIEKLDQEIIRVTSRIEQLQERLKKLQQKRIELENTTILELVKSVNATPEQLAALIREFKEQGRLDLQINKESVNG